MGKVGSFFKAKVGKSSLGAYDIVYHEQINV